MNNLIKSFWFRRTGRGGATERGKGKKSKLRSVAKWMQRRMMWMGGYDEARVLSEWAKIQEELKIGEAVEAEILPVPIGIGLVPVMDVLAITEAPDIDANV
eukprot:scaffold91300_cov34-Attheya_sp.AAC.1